VLETALAEANFSIFVLYIILLLPGLILKEDKKVYYIVYNITVILGILFYYSLLNYYGEPYFVGGSDDKYYELWSNDILQTHMWYNPVLIEQGGYLPIGHNSPLYVIILAGLRIFCDNIDSFHTIAPKILNASFLAMTSCLTLKIAQIYFGNKNSVVIAFSYGLYPIILSIACFSFRDTIVAFLFILVVFSMEKSRTNFSYILLSFIILCIVSYLLFYLRKLFVPLLIGLFFIRYYLKMRNNSLSIRSIIVLCIIMFSSLIFWNVSFDKITYLNDAYSTYRADNLSTGLGKILFRMPLFPFGIILRYFYLLIPFQIPVEFSSGFNFVGNIIQYFFVSFFLYGSFIIYKNNKPFRIYIIFTHLFLIMIAVTSFTWRHLTIIYPFFIMITVECLIQLDRKIRNRIISFSTMFLLLLIATYTFLKLSL